MAPRKRKLKPGEPRYRSPTPKPGGPLGIWFDEAAAAAATAFFPRYCRLTKDKWAGKVFELPPWQADYIIRQAFGWKRAPNPGGTRLYRRVIIWVPRKNGKTELLAGVSHLCLLGDAVWGAECYSIASVGNQAEIILDRASQMVAYSPELAAEYEVFSNSLYIPVRRSIFQALSGKPTSLTFCCFGAFVGDRLGLVNRLARPQRERQPQLIGALVGDEAPDLVFLTRLQSLLLPRTTATLLAIERSIATLAVELQAPRSRCPRQGIPHRLCVSIAPRP